jgi:hypothetical protein
MMGYPGQSQDAYRGPRVSKGGGVIVETPQIELHRYREGSFDFLYFDRSLNSVIINVS